MTRLSSVALTIFISFALFLFLLLAVATVAGAQEPTLPLCVDECLEMEGLE